MRPPRFFLAAAFTTTYVWHAASALSAGRPAYHALVGAAAFSGGWVHAAVAWAKRRALAQEAGGGGELARKDE
jgi:hypothetical protein